VIQPKFLSFSENVQCGVGKLRQPIQRWIPAKRAKPRDPGSVKIPPNLNKNILQTGIFQILALYSFVIPLSFRHLELEAPPFREFRRAKQVSPSNETHLFRTHLILGSNFFNLQKICNF